MGVRRALGWCLSALIVAGSVPRAQRLPSKSWAAPHTPHGEARCRNPGSRFTGRFLPRFGPIDLYPRGARKNHLLDIQASPSLVSTAAQLTQSRASRNSNSNSLSQHG